MQNKTVIINKLGSDHLDYSINNQDYFFVSDKIKMVFDGCSSGKNSEVGSILFSALFSQLEKQKQEDCDSFKENIDTIFKRLLDLSSDINFIFDKYCFTIVAVFETETDFIVKYAGDGYVITQKDDNIEYIALDDGCNNGYPKYYIYNYIQPEYLLDYKEGIKIQTRIFSKEKYQKVGVATDGLQYVNNLEWQEQSKVKEYLLNAKTGKLKMLINRNRIHLHDDITICF